ncbi:Hypothetical predicted protein [Octopus vulgaris]|uniref:Uncharacterized protein n=1 Tax=Octopus vulgaris TaxID=6645 RepID=A0AA36B9J2_OCTVU|nr:Hypothetical predicted protein [Octopus vulgaris]
MYADDSTLYSCLDKPGDLPDKVEITGNLENDIRSIVELVVADSFYSHAMIPSHSLEISSFINIMGRKIIASFQSLDWKSMSMLRILGREDEEEEEEEEEEEGGGR